MQWKFQADLQSVSLLEMNYGLQLGTFWRYLNTEDGTTIPISIVFWNVYIYVNRGLLRLLELCFHSILKPIQVNFYFIVPYWKLPVCMFSVLLSSELSGNWTSVLSRRLERSGVTHKLLVQICIVDWSLIYLLLYSTLYIIFYLILENSSHFQSYVYEKWRRLWSHQESNWKAWSEA